MSNNLQPHRLDRIRYWQGQRLNVSDLQTQIENVDQLRWWHNRMHDAFGVAEGMRVQLAEDGASVTVSPGVAYDAFGRELFLFEETAVCYPEPTGSEQLLLASFQDAVGTTPHLYWKPSAWFSTYDGAILARQSAIGELLVGKLARADKRPYIAYGATIPGNTNWETGDLANLPNKSCDKTVSISYMPQKACLKLKIETSAAGFVQTPHFFATVQGDPQVQFMRTFVTCPTPTGFTLFVYYLYESNTAVFASNSDELASEYASSELLSAFQDNRVWVSWIGLEPYPNQGAKE